MFSRCLSHITIRMIQHQRKSYEESCNIIKTTIDLIINNTDQIKVLSFQNLYHDVYIATMGWKNHHQGQQFFDFIIKYVEQLLLQIKTYNIYRAIYDVLLFPRRNNSKLNIFLNRNEKIFKERETSLLFRCYNVLTLPKNRDYFKQIPSQIIDDITQRSKSQFYNK